MKTQTLLLLALVLIAVPPLVQADPGPMRLWFTTPGTPGDTKSWQQEGLPIGNGKLAAMIYGGVGTEHIQFNEDTIWGGQPHDYSNPNSTPAQLASIRSTCFSGGDILTAAKSYLMSVPIRQAAYQAPGWLQLTFPHSGTANYLRSLDLNTATVNVHYDYNGVTYNRDIFASAPSNRVIVLRFTASQTAKVGFTCSFGTPQTATYSTVGNDLIMHAAVSAIADSRYYSGGLTNGVKYDARVRLINTGGSVSSTSSSLSVTNADEVVLLMSVVSNVKAYNDLTEDYVTVCSNNVAAAAAMGYTALRQAQQDDYTNLYNRVVLDLGGNSRTNQPIGYRKKQIAIDGNDPQLVALDFQLGRYLMIAGSRPGSQPLNLQGKWNDSTAPSWDSKMTLNVNEELNYGGAEVCNLSECVEPLIDMVADLAVTGHKVAQSNYYSDGWVAHHNTDLWRGAAAINGVDGIWPTGGAWLCQLVWWHYQYTGDTNWLATTGYPLLKGAAQFFQGYLVDHPNPSYPYKVSCPSYSPEHDDPGGHPNVAGPTMDNELIRELFNDVVEASEILGVDAGFRADIINLRAQLPPEKIGGIGQLEEWLNYDEGTYDAGHRHCSHLVGLSPGNLISTYYTPTTAKAALKSVQLRGYASTSITPWGDAVRVNLRTRLQDGEGAWQNLMVLYGYNKVSTNLVFADNHRQVDAIFGRLSGIAEMFLQSQDGDVNLLPALPSKLPAGKVSGLCARGGFQVDNMTWTNGRLTGAIIVSKLGNVCRVRSKWPVTVKQGSGFVDAPMILPGLWEFATTAGQSYEIVPANLWEAESLSATTSGDSLATVSNPMFSNEQGRRLNANATTDFVTYGVTNVTAGTYRVHVVADAGADRGQFQLAVGPSGGTLSDLGPVQDTYSSTNFVTLYSTNMLTEYDCGSLEVGADGDYDFKFTVAGKNAASSGYALVLDYIKLTPVTTVPAPTLTATLYGDQIVLSWPTNSGDFSLVGATNLPAASWEPVVPAPVVVDGRNVVTNDTLQSQAFYRLVSP